MKVPEFDIKAPEFDKKHLNVVFINHKDKENRPIILNILNYQVSLKEFRQIILCLFFSILSSIPICYKPNIYGPVD